MNPLDGTQGLPTWLLIALIVVGVLAALALVNHAVARLAERRHPPAGAFLDVDGVRLHHSERGTGRPVVLLHGNAVTGADYSTSGVAERLVGKYRVIVFDRPGFGHSARPPCSGHDGKPGAAYPIQKRWCGGRACTPLPVASSCTHGQTKCTGEKRCCASTACCLAGRRPLPCSGRQSAWLPA